MLALPAEKEKEKETEKVMRFLAPVLALPLRLGRKAQFPEVNSCKLINILVTTGKNEFPTD